jgi:hypothetical protein
MNDNLGPKIIKLEVSASAGPKASSIRPARNNKDSRRNCVSHKDKEKQE